MTSLWFIFLLSDYKPSNLRNTFTSRYYRVADNDFFLKEEDLSKIVKQFYSIKLRSDWETVKRFYFYALEKIKDNLKVEFLVGK